MHDITLEKEKIKDANSEKEENNIKNLEIQSFIKFNDTNNVNLEKKKKRGNKLLKKIIYNIIAILYNLLSFLFYYLSLEGCFDIQSKCIPKLSTMFLGRILIFGILFSVMISIELYLILNKIIHFFHLIYIIIFYIIIYRYDHGSKLDYHGLYNFVLSLFLKRKRIKSIKQF